jgi:8-oxo-dGTP diphosphatase
MLSVAVGVIYNNRGQVLIAKRRANKSQAGLWEYPGGKQEATENITQALQRELYEELNIRIQAARPLIRIAQQQVLLDVWQVQAWNGAIYGKEGQEIYWCELDELANKEFLPANPPITTAIRLPSTYLVTPEPQVKLRLFLGQLERSLQAAPMLVQFRANQLNLEDYYHYAEAVLKLCNNYNIPLLINNSPEVAVKLGAAGVHLNSSRLQQLQARPLANNLWVSASCHTVEEIQQANKYADFMLLSPVKFTNTHPQAQVIGWRKFWQLTELATIPVFALGGMQLSHIPVVWAHGGQGIAAISSLWIAS